MLLVILALIILSVLIVVVFRNQQNNSYQLLNKKENCFYDIYDMKTKLVLKKKCVGSKHIDSIVLYKNQNEYFQMFFNLEKRSEDQKLILSVKKDTFYYYGPDASFYCNIKRLGKDRFKTSLANSDSIHSKYRFSFYYDVNYKIRRIEYVLDDEVENYDDNR